MKRLPVLFLSIVLLFSSCNFLPGSSGSSNNILVAPILNQMQKEIYDELEQVLDTNKIVYKYPSYGGQRSPFIFYDINNDGREEVIVFYSYKDNQEELFAKVLVQDENNHWRPFYDIPCYGNQVDFIDFAPLLTKDKSCIVIGWTKDRASYFGVYSMGESSIDTEFIEPYTKYLLEDIDNDSIKEILLTQTLAQDEEDIFLISLFGLQSNKISLMSKLSLYEETSQVNQMLVGNIPNYGKAVYIDEELGGASISYGTEVFGIKNNQLKTLVGDNRAQEDTKAWEEFAKTFRTGEKILSHDFKGDKTIEVPRISEVNTQGQDYSDGSGVPRLIEYMQLVNGKFEIKHNIVRNKNFNYIINLPERWIGNVSIVEQPQRQEWRVYKINKITGLPTVELLRIRVFYSSTYIDEIAEDDFLIATKGLFNYYAYIPETNNEPLAITKQELKESIFALV